MSEVISSAQADFEKVFEVANQYSMCGRERLQSLYVNALRVAAIYPEANFVDCGVAAGGSSAVLAAALRKSFGSETRRVYCFDTFQGLPEPGEYDTREGKNAADLGWGAGTCAADVTSLQEACTRLGVEDLIVPVAGLFADTIPAWTSTVAPIALLHMDGDWYESTLQILESLYAAVTEQGVIQVDDYGYWDGCRRAVHEFFDAQRLSVIPHEIDSTGVLIKKLEVRSRDHQAEP